MLLSVTCEGGEGNSTFYVDYRTEDGSAKAGSDYEYRWVPRRAPGGSQAPPHPAASGLRGLLVTSR